VADGSSEGTPVDRSQLFNQYINEFHSFVHFGASLEQSSASAWMGDRRTQVEVEGSCPGCGQGIIDRYLVQVGQEGGGKSPRLVCLRN
jgi:hypothetical protein